MTMVLLVKLIYIFNWTQRQTLPSATTTVLSTQASGEGPIEEIVIEE